ncbi:hypothetical protein AAII07_56100, partial [Microvirga sp. 0TCS3.31]
HSTMLCDDEESFSLNKLWVVQGRLLSFPKWFVFKTWGENLGDFGLLLFFPESIKKAAHGGS